LRRSCLPRRRRHFPTRFDRWHRAPAVALLLTLAALTIAVAWPTARTPQPSVRASTAEQTDLKLYRAIIARMRAGEDYYPAAADELRKGSYPLRPFVTVRLPTLALLHAHTPPVIMTMVQALLALAVLFAWWRRLASGVGLPARVTAGLLLVAGTAGLLSPAAGLLHESWAGLLLALMIGVRRRGHAALAIVAGALAVAIRETALPMILVMGALALIERRGKEALGWVAVVALFAGAMVAHAAMVGAVVLPTDPVSPGWNGMLGARFALAAIAGVSSATLLPGPLAALLLLLSLFGWISLATSFALRVSLLLLGYGAMLALFSRADTFYWALLAAPLSLVGLVFVPRALSALVSAARGVAQPPS